MAIKKGKKLTKTGRYKIEALDGTKRQFVGRWRKLLTSFPPGRIRASPRSRGNLGPRCAGMLSFRHGSSLEFHVQSVSLCHINGM